MYVYNIYNHLHFLSFIFFIFQDSLAAMFELDKISVHAIVAKMIISEELMASMDEPTECKNFKINVFTKKIPTKMFIYIFNVF